MKHLDLKMPTTWNALTRRQLLYLCRLYRMNLTEFKFKTYLFVKFTGIKVLPKQIIADHVYYFFRKGKTRFSLSVDEMHWFLRAVHQFTEESKLTKNNFPYFRILHKRFFGPSNTCYNITVHEFLFAERILDAFHQQQNPVYLRQLCAILYRPQVKPYRPNNSGYNGDRRQPFNDYNYARRARWFKLLPHEKQMAVYVFYVGCRNAIIEKHPHLFNSTTVSSETQNHVDNMKQVLIALNQGDITKNKEILQTQIWEAFGQLNEMVKQNKQAKAKQ